MRPVSLIVLLVLASASVAAQVPAPSTSAGQGTRSTPQAPLSTATFLGGVPFGTATDAVETITILTAITRALEYNLGVLTAEQNLGRAQGARRRALSDMLPNINGRIAETRQTINLAAFGFGPGSGSPFGDLPTIVGPFNVFDARVFVSQSVLDFGALNGARAEAHNLEAARYTY